MTLIGRIGRGRGRALGAILAAAAVIGIVLALTLSGPGPPAPGAFYRPPSRLPAGPPGTLIRVQPLRDFYPSTRAYRVLYKSTGFDGRPTAVSGVIVVPEGRPPPGGRRIVAFTHGTVGVARGCAPSLQARAFAQVAEGLGEFLAAGYVVAATDYQGLGTPGRTPYLVGRVEAMNALDIVRAAHRLHSAHAGVTFVVWGHSQGGHAALFAAQLATSYAPFLRLVGVAAGAPVPDLADFFAVNEKTPVGRVLLAMTVSAWSRFYGPGGAERLTAPASRPLLESIAGQCLYGRQILAAGPSSLVLGLTFARPRWTHQPWRTIAAENTPGQAPIGVPVLITQGAADKVVPAAVTARFVRGLCRRGDVVQERLYPGVEHFEAGILAAPDVLAWIRERFAGRPAPSTCR